MRWIAGFWVVVLAAGTVGCNRSASASNQTKPPVVTIDPNKPEDTLYEQVRAGSTQIEGVVDTLDTVLEQVKGVDSGKDPDIKAVFVDLKDSVDAAGAALAGYTDARPQRAAVVKQFAKFDEWRIGAIAAGNDARHELIDAQGLADSLAETANIGKMTDIADLLEVAIEDLKDAIETLGGKVED